jgi:hypothetical protein
MLQPITIKVAKWYCIWICFWVLVAIYGNTVKGSAEFGLGAWVWLTISGLPLSLLSWYIEANGSYFCIFMVGAIGLAQWCVVAELNARYDAWRKSKNAKT